MLKKLFAVLMILPLVFLPQMVKAENYIAKIGDNNYATLEEAIAAAKPTDTIVIQNDVVLSNSISILKDITIDLNGNTISATDRTFKVQGAKFTVTGKGVIKEEKPYYAPITLFGSNKEEDTNYTTVTIGKDVTLIGWTGLFITPYLDLTNNNASPAPEPYAYGVVINMDGTALSVQDIDGYDGHAIYINGQIKHKTNCPIINTSSTTVLKSTGDIIYAAGYAIWNMNGGVFEGDSDGLSIKSGVFNINGTNIKTTGKDSSPTEGNSNGINASGAAIQIESNKNYAGAIQLNLVDAKVESTKGIAVYEYLACEPNTACTTDTTVESISIKGGDYKAGPNKNIFMFSQALATKQQAFIETGSFNGDPSLYVKAGYKIVNNTGVYTVSKIESVDGNKTLGGTITGGENAKIQLKQGSKVMKATVASDTGKYEFTSVAPGLYNMYINNDKSSVMRVVKVTDNTIFDTTLPDIGKISIIVKDDKTPDVIISGLEDVDHDGDVKFIIESIPSSTKSDAKKAIVAEANNDAIQYYDFSIVSDDKEISETKGIITIAIPYDFADKLNITLSRYHDSNVELFTKLNEIPTTLTDKTYYLDIENNMIYVYTNKFSTYAIGYDVSTPSIETPEVENIVNPQTSDSIMNYVSLGIISTLGIIIIATYCKRKKTV